MDDNSRWPATGPKRPNTSFVLCFDGTGNKFSGTPADSNILKIFRMLDAADPAYHVYYQPGIGTYVQSNTYSHTSVFTKTYSWVQKTRDSMIGSSFDQHLMAGYKFLMKYYSAGDDIYIFGFSRGSYTARFLAQMLDAVGLLPAGNEEMARFAFKAFARWQRRLDGTEEERKQKKEMYEYMSAFRETFSRPVRRIRFLGLFDTVNSVPRFEARFMKRSKFPYTARSSALYIRHAVSIDERRAKFRQDLMGQGKPRASTRNVTVDRSDHHHLHHGKQTVEKHSDSYDPSQRFRRHSARGGRGARSKSRGRSAGGAGQQTRPVDLGSDETPLPPDQRSVATDTASQSSWVPPPHTHHDHEEEDDEEDLPSDIQELWFPGCHADIGGGWPLDEGEEFPLSHAPLVWMVREAQKAGLRFRHDVMVHLKVIDDTSDTTDAHDYAYASQETSRHGLGAVPELKIEQPSPTTGKTNPMDGDPTVGAGGDLQGTRVTVDQTLALSAEKGRVHDSLKFAQGTPMGGVIGWKIMEWLPFAR